MATNIPTNGNDNILGTPEADTLQGLAGNDTLNGLAGDDLLLGGPGDDVLVGGPGADTLDGGEGVDKANYAIEGGPGGVRVDLRAGTATDTFGTTDRLISIEHVHGSDMDDTILGSAGNDVIFGRAGDDFIDGGEGGDLVYSGAGNDHIVVGATLPGARDTVVIDGPGNKVITGTGSLGTPYGHHLVFDLNEAVTVNLGEGYARSAGMTLDFTAARHFVELGGTAFDDLLMGGNLDSGHAKWLSGNQGNDTLDGGTGHENTVSYDDEVLYGAPDPATGRREYGNRGVVVDLAAGVATDSFGFTDELRNIHWVRATKFADRLTGSSGANSFWGLAGADTIDGGDGIDRVHYREDVLTGGTAGVIVDLGQGYAIDGFGDRDTLISIEEAYATDSSDTLIGSAGDNQLYGYDGDDTLSGAGGNDTLVGGRGQDTLSGGSGDDELWGGPGNDLIDGGEGRDVVRYDDAPRAVVVDLEAGRALDGDGGNDSLAGIEGVFGSAHDDTIRGGAGNDILRGQAGNDTIAGGGGDDTLLGGTGNDTLSGGIGNDEIWGEAGNDLIDGGAGTDLVRYRNSPAGISGDLAAGRIADGFGGTDTLAGIENVDGSDHGDSIAGDAAANRLFGFAGGDTLAGAGGNDTILGGDGDDLISGGDGDDQIWGEAGNDTIDGGDGIDMVRYRNSPAGVMVDLMAGMAQDGFGTTDRLSGIEEVHGSDHGDRLTGDSGDNQMFGFGGADTLDGGPGNDMLVGGAGGDTYIFGAGYGYDVINDFGLPADDADRVIVRDYIAANARVVVRNDRFVLDFGATGDVLVLANSVDPGNPGAIESVIFADGVIWDHAAMMARAGLPAVQPAAGNRATQGNDTLFGTGGDDSLAGGAGDDVIHGLAGSDTLDGGDGNDTLNGLGGNDRLEGGDGNDSLNGGDGNDTLSGGPGNDTLVGGNGTADLRDVIYGGDGDDSIDGGYGNDELNGGAGNDTVLGGFGSDTLIGNEGNDWLSGGPLSDMLYGGPGDDTLDGGFGHDRMNGGPGADRFRHEGIPDHGSDWIQDYNAAEGDVLVMALAGAARDQFQVNFAGTSGAGQAGVDEAFVIYKPTGQTLWALVDGAAQEHINILIGGQIWDLLV